MDRVPAFEHSCSVKKRLVSCSVGREQIPTPYYDYAWPRFFLTPGQAPGKWSQQNERGKEQQKITNVCLEGWKAEERKVRRVDKNRASR